MVDEISDIDAPLSGLSDLRTKQEEAKRTLQENIDIFRQTLEKYDPGVPAGNYSGDGWFMDELKKIAPGRVDSLKVMGVLIGKDDIELPERPGTKASRLIYGHTTDTYGKEKTILAIKFEPGQKSAGGPVYSGGIFEVNSDERLAVAAKCVVKFAEEEKARIVGSTPQTDKSSAIATALKPLLKE